MTADDRLKRLETGLVKTMAGFLTDLRLSGKTTTGSNAMNDKIPGGFIRWAGVEPCPTHPKAQVRLFFRGGSVYTGQADSFFWGRDEKTRNSDIIAYKIEESAP